VQTIRAEDFLEAARAGDAEARRKVLEITVPDVKLAVRVFRRRAKGYEFGDLLSEGCIAVERAIRYYRGEGGASFATYAKRCAVSAMQDFVRSYRDNRYKQLSNLGLKAPLSLHAPVEGDRGQPVEAWTTVASGREKDPHVAASEKDDWEALLEWAPPLVRREATRFFRDGLSVTEMAKAADRNASTMSGRVKEAKVGIAAGMKARGIARHDEEPVKKFTGDVDGRRGRTRMDDPTYEGRSGYRYKAVVSDRGEHFPSATHAATHFGLTPGAVANAIRRGHLAAERAWSFATTKGQEVAA
jgi:RNA polymerase sigma factor (sigma-70 family)